MTEDKSEIEIAAGMDDFGIVREGFLRGVNFDLEPISYIEHDGYAIFEGDIILCTVTEMDLLVERAQTVDDLSTDGLIEALGVGRTGARYRWPNATMPYRIASNLPNQARVIDAIKHWEAKTKMKFVKRTATNATQYSDFVTFRPSTGCSSSVGRIGGEQFINLSSSCLKGNTIHEIGHALGLWHEQSRSDRDNNVTVHLENVKAGREHNFNKHIQDGDDYGAYDYGSIMHYPSKAFSKNGQDTIVPKKTIQIGQRKALSAGDISAIHTMYGL